MPFNIPYTYFGLFYENALIVYAVVNFTLTFAYLLLFYLMRNKPGMVRSVLLSVIPSVIFIFSGITLRSIPLIVCSAGFSVTHVLISVMNVKLGKKAKKIRSNKNYFFLSTIKKLKKKRLNRLRLRRFLIHFP